MTTWILCKVAPYVVVPACTYIGTTVGTHVGMRLAGRAWDALSDRVRGNITITLKRARCYIIHKGNIIDIDPRKKYTIIGGELTIEDGDDKQTVSLDEWCML